MAELDPASPEFQAREVRKFARTLALAATALAALPVLIGVMARPEGATYLPFHLSLDDHMVYAAWMRLAMDGHVLFDNRFTTDPQPGLTFHALFLALGLLAKLVGIPVALTLARLGFTYLSVRMLGEFVVRLGLRSFEGKLAVTMAVFGGGLAFLHWQTFGDGYPPGDSSVLSSILHGRQPVDNWQPEAFLFPAMLTNGLFLAAACLLFWCLNSVLDSRRSWKPVLAGVVAFALLMNVHSYDVALIAFVLVAFVASLVAARTFETRWAMRSVVIALGAVPPALWFLLVLADDPVFRARAETLTYTGSFLPVLVGVLPVVLLALLALWRSELPLVRRAIGTFGIVAILALLSIVANGASPGYQLSPVAWAAFALAVVALACTVATKHAGWNLIWSWALVSLVAPYFPALFQRKLAMLMVVPWAVIAAIGLARELQRMERQPRNLVAALALAVVCLTSVFWLRRDVELVKSGVSKTTVHSLYLTHDETEIVQRLQDAQGAGVLAMPGVPAPQLGERPYLNDLSPALSGLAGVHTYAGHWSETPSYNERRAQATDFFLRPMPMEQRLALLKQWKVRYVVVPKPNVFPAVPFTDLGGLGETVYDGAQLSLVKIREG